MVYSTHTHTHHAMVLRALHTHKQLEISNTNATLCVGMCVVLRPMDAAGRPLSEVLPPCYV